MVVSPLRRLSMLPLRLTESALPLVFPMPIVSIGPLKGLRLRLAKIKPWLGGGKALKAAFDSPRAVLGVFVLLMGLRTTRMLFGNWGFVGVAGRTLTEDCGVRESLALVEVVGEARDVDEVEEALEWLW
jgi:hypothetical protein